MKNAFEPMTNTIKDTSRDTTKTSTESSITNNKAIENLNNKLIQLMKDRGVIASYLMSPLSKITSPENTTQYKLVKDSNSNRVNDLLIHNSIPISLHDNLLTFRDTAKIFELKGDLLKLITNKNINVNHASLLDKKLLYDFANEMHFDVKCRGNKSTGDRTLIKLLKSPAIMASGNSTMSLPSYPNGLCDRLKLLRQEKQAGNNSDKINEEIVAIVDKLLEYKCISNKHYKQILVKCNLLHTEEK